MSIKPCFECAVPISDKAELCPNCGVKQKKKTSRVTWMILVFILLMILMVILDSTNDSTPVNQVNGSESQRTNKAGVLLFFAQERIKAHAKDSSSVKFRGEQIHEITDQGAVACGEYNAKNSFGAYVGFKGFVAIEKSQKLYVEGIDGKEFVDRWNSLCVNK